LFICFAKNHMPQAGSDPKNPKEPDKSRDGWQQALVVFARLSVWIAGPVVLAVFLGKWLDRKYDSDPYLFLAAVGAAFLISMAGLIKNTVEEYKRIEKEAEEDKNRKKEREDDE